MKLFVALMQRYGNNEAHHYVIGIYTTREQAEFAGDAEKSWRGGKYEVLVQEFEVDKPIEQEVYDYHIRCVPPKD